MFFISCKDLMLYNQFYLLNVIAYMYLFVYGTLLSTEYNHQTIKSSKLVGEGSIYGKLFDIGNYPALKKGEGIIVGREFVTNSFDKILSDFPLVTFMISFK